MGGLRLARVPAGANTAGYGVLYVYACEVPALLYGCGGIARAPPREAPSYDDPAGQESQELHLLQVAPARGKRYKLFPPGGHGAGATPYRVLADPLFGALGIEAVRRASRLARWRRPPADDSRGSGQASANNASSTEPAEGRRQPWVQWARSRPLSSDGSRASPISQVLGRNGQDLDLDSGFLFLIFGFLARSFLFFCAESPLPVG